MTVKNVKVGDLLILNAQGIEEGINVARWGVCIAMCDSTTNVLDDVLDTNGKMHKYVHLFYFDVVSANPPTHDV